MGTSGGPRRLDVLSGLRATSSRDPFSVVWLAALLGAAIPSGSATEAREVAALLESARNDRAAAVLRLLTQFARAPLAAEAKLAAARLQEAGVVAPGWAEPNLADAATFAMTRMQHHDLVLAELRYRDPQIQTVWVLLRRAPDQLLAGNIAAAVRRGASERVSGYAWNVVRDDDAEAAAARRISPAHAKRLLARGVRGAAEAHRLTTPEAAVALTVVWVALGGTSDELPEFPLGATTRGDHAKGVLRRSTRSAFDRRTELTLTDFERWVEREYGRESAPWRLGDVMAGAMLEYRYTGTSHAVSSWRVQDVLDFLLSWFPSKVVLPSEITAGEVRSATIAFLRFLAARGMLIGDPLDDLLAACQGLPAGHPAVHSARFGAHAQAWEAMRVLLDARQG